MLAIAALVIFIIAAVVAFLHVMGALFVLGLIATGLACLAASVGFGLGPVVIRR